MARIQKKKPAFKARKKETPAVSDTLGNADKEQMDPDKADSAGNDAGGAVAVSIPEKKKKAYTVKRPSTDGQSMVMELTEKYFGNWIQFFREVRVELTKVTWPSKKQTIGSTAVVIVFVFVIAVFLGIVDIGLSSFIRLFL